MTRAPVATTVSNRTMRRASSSSNPLLLTNLVPNAASKKENPELGKIQPKMAYRRPSAINRPLILNCRASLRRATVLLLHEAMPQRSVLLEATYRSDFTEFRIVRCVEHFVCAKLEQIHHQPHRAVDVLVNGANKPIIGEEPT